MEVIKCDDCWRFGVKQVSVGRGRRHWFCGFKCGETLDLAVGIVGCTKGVTTSMIIEAITEECDRNKEEANACADRHEALENAFYSLKKQKNYLQQKENIFHPPRANRREKYIWTSNPWSNRLIVMPVGVDDCDGAKKHELHLDTFMRSVKLDEPYVVTEEDKKQLATYLCENCQEPVIVPKDMLKDELRFKCQACHQENHYDLS